MIKLTQGPSIRWRIMLANLVLLLVFITLTVAALENAFKTHAKATRLERLQAMAYLVMAATELDSSGKLQLPTRFADPELLVPGSGLYAKIVNAKAHWESPSTLGQDVLFANPLPPGQRAFITLEDHGKSYLGFAIGVSWPSDKGPIPLTFCISEDTKPFEQRLSQYRHTLWNWLGACAGVLLILQVILLRWGLKPLRRVASALRAIESGEKDHLDGSYPKELQPLTHNLNALISHERARQQRYENALADLAHSLKTPIAVINSTDTHDPDFAHTVHEQTHRIESLISYQLQRAATRGSSPLAKQTELAPQIQRLISTLGKVYRDKGLLFDNQLPEDLKTTLTESDALELFGNLLDNAAKWAATTVIVRAGRQGEKWRIAIEDDGPGVKDPSAMLQRGARADETVPGHGIGLAIVVDIVHSYGGDISISRGQVLSGACFTVTV